MNKLFIFKALKKLATRKNRRFIASLIGFVLFIFFSMEPSLARDTPEFHILDNQPQELLPTKSSVTPSPDLQKSPSKDSVTPSPRGLDNRSEFADFVNNFFEQQLAKSNIPGAVISVVKDGEIFFTNGYGYANLEKEIPVDADKTLFRVASLSKLITATAAMQLYERGALDLDRDVNEYLEDWQIENPYPEAVTPARMMMHTDGTTQRLIGLGARTKEKMQPLARYLPQYMPPINYTPGKFYSYSNHSIALLGYLVQKISGIPFIEYVERNIFQPLEMSNSTFAQPPVSELPDNFATGYQIQNGKAKPVPYLYLNIAPAAALMTTATDMAHFMLAHLQQGSYGGSQILQPETTEMMHQTHYQIHPKVPGTSYGFRERLINNKRAIGHLGSLRGYSSFLNLIPEENIGIFIATNSFSNVHGEFIDRFFDRYFPEQSKKGVVTPEVPSQKLQKYAGTYRDMEYPRSTIAKITGIAKEIRVTTQPNGTLLIQTPPLLFRSNVENIELTPTEESDLFYRQNDDAYVFFVEDESGIQNVSNPLSPKIGTYQRVSWYETIKLHVGLLALCAIFFLTATIAGIIRPLLRIFSQKKIPSPKLTWVRTVAGAIGMLNLIFLIGLPLYLWRWGAWKLVYGVPPVAVCLFGLPVLTSILSLILLIMMLVVWRKSYWSTLGRFHYTGITIASIVFIPLLVYWNLYGWQF